MFTFLHLYLIPPSDKLLIKSDIWNPMGDTLADNLERVESSSNNISSEENSTFNDPNSSLNRSFNETLGRLIDDFPNSLSKIVHKYIRITQNIYGSRYFVYFFENLFPVELSSLIDKLKQIDIFLIKPWQFDLRFRNIGQGSSKQSNNSVDNNITPRGRFDTERKFNNKFTNFNLPDKNRFIPRYLFLNPLKFLSIWSVCFIQFHRLFLIRSIKFLCHIVHLTNNLIIQFETDRFNCHPEIIELCYFIAL